jgi:hypothetical protein
MHQIVKGENGTPSINSIGINENLRLRDDVMSHAKKREWIFKGIGGTKDTILLAPPTEDYEWEARIEYIDWNEYRNRKKEETEPR